MYQEKLYQSVKSLIDRHKFPHTCLVEGEYGCGKHTLVNFILENMGLAMLTLSSPISDETIEQMYLSPTPTIYLIEAESLKVRDQYALLKTLEEPLKNSYLIIICENRNILLNTILNRCQVFKFDPVKLEDLVEMFGTDQIPMYANTPGRVKEFSQFPTYEMIDYCEKILTKIGQANYSNSLNILGKIAFKDGDIGYPHNLFLYLLTNVCVDLYKKSLIPYLYVKIVNEWYSQSKIPHINKSQLCEKYLIRLKLVTENYGA